MKNIFFLLIIFLVSCRSYSSKNSINIDSASVTSSTYTSINNSYDSLSTSNKGDYPSYESIEKSQPYKENNVKIENRQIKENKQKVIFDDNFIDTVSNDIGTIVYNVPDTMKVGIHYKISLRITRQKYTNNIIISINRNTTHSTTTISNIKTSNVMDAVLVATKGDFTIDNSLSSTRQKIDGDYNEWIWDVVPNKKGYNNLRLIVKIIYISDGGYVKDLTVFEKDIYTEPNYNKSINDFLPEWNWNWIWSAIILPVFLYFWKKRKKRRK